MTNLERAFESGILAYGKDLPPHEVQARVIPGRKYRADFAWRDYQLAVWIEGGLGGRTGHFSVSGVLTDMKRQNAYAKAGVLVLRFSAKDLTSRTLPDTINEVRSTLEAIRNGRMETDARIRRDIRDQQPRDSASGGDRPTERQSDAGAAPGPAT